MTWDEVLESAQAGEGAAAESRMDRDAFAGFYERMARPLWAYLAKVSGDPALADDLVQESFVRMLCAATPMDGELHAKRYLFRIATNLLKDYWRRPKASSIEDLPEAAFAAACGEGMDAQMMLEPRLLQLRPRERQLLWLAHAEGYSHKEIAEIMGLRSPSIRLMLFRARHRLAELLKDGGAR
ncbi:MAG TPA: RNA polymerase sigma factor [Acidobacteriaceae bacterium]|nr:RNA polymerase sigma factor [Acidobacteriaceae bacterium]